MRSPSWATGTYSEKSSLLLLLFKPSECRSIPGWIQWSALQTRPPLILMCHLTGNVQQTAAKNIESGLQAEKILVYYRYVGELYLSAKCHKKSMTFKEELRPVIPSTICKEPFPSFFCLIKWSYKALGSDSWTWLLEMCLPSCQRASHKHI